MCGLCNRLRVIMFFYNSLKESESLTVIWKYKQDHDRFLDFFETLPRLTFIEHNVENLDYEGNGSDLVQHGVLNPGLYKHLRLRSHIKDMVNEMRSELGHNYIAAHIRRTDHTQYAKSNNAFTTDKSFIKFMKGHPNTDIYIATDNAETFLKFKKRFPDRIKINNTENFIEQGRRHTATIAAVIDLYMCIHAKEFMGSGHSSFTDFIADNRCEKTLQK